MSAPEAVSDLLFRPALELAALVRAGEVTARELTEAALARIGALDERVGAFAVLDADRALAAADAIGPGDPRPFAGVPLAMKDLLTAVAGLPQTNGSSFFGEFVPQHDASLTRRFRDAGFVIVGATKVPEFAILPVTEPRRFGAARNPWDLERTPGGSSGGAAAAVAAGMVPVAHASDGAGSIRIPAACCGLVGLKPSRGRISPAPHLGHSFLTTDGVLTRTVADTAAALDALAGYETGDATWATPPAEPFAAAAAREPRRLRIGVATEPPIEAPVDPTCLAAARDAGDLLAGLGHDVGEAAPPWQQRQRFREFTTLWVAFVGSTVSIGVRAAGREPTDEDIEPLSMVMYRKARATDSVKYVSSQVSIEAFGREVVGYLDAFDVIVTPALAQRPVRVGAIDACSEDPWDDFRRSGQFTPYTSVVNITGQPAIALPVFHGDDGLPLAVQLIGRPEDEATLLSLAAQLEAARPWSGRRPALET